MNADDYTLPNQGDIVIEEDGDVPIIVERIDDGEIIGLDPDGIEISIPMEHMPHLIDAWDL